MAITSIRSILNSTESDCYIRNFETPDDTGGDGKFITLEAGETLTCDMWIPWAGNQHEFDHGSSLFKGPAHIDISFSSSTDIAPSLHHFSIWQQGDYVHYSKDGTWENDGFLVPGNNTVGGDRSVEIVGDAGEDADLRFY